MKSRRYKQMVVIQNIVSSNNVYYLNRFAKEYKKRGFQMTVLFCSHSEANRRWRLEEKIRFDYRILPNLRLELKGRDLFTYFINPSIVRTLNQLNPSLVLIVGWDNFANQVAYLWSKLHHRKIILRSGSTSFEKSWRRTLAYPLVKAIIRGCDEYIAYGTRSRDYLISLGAKPQSIRIIHNDVNRRYFRLASDKYRKKKLYWKRFLGIKTKHNLLYVGQLIERKGIDLLMRSYKFLKKNNPQLGLVIIGYGQLKPIIESEIKHNHLKNVRLVGYVEQYDLPKYYAIVDAFVLPSREEVWGLVANEAIACNLPTIVSDACGCAPDLIKPGINGEVFASDDYYDLALKIRKTLKLK